MTIDKQALRERYSPKPVPKCHICGEEMTIQRISASRITYGCTGEGDDGYFKFGRTFVDEHYEKSRVTVVDVSDPDVLALLDENLQLQREKDAIEAVALALRDDMRQAREQLEAAEKRIAEQREYYEGVIADGSKRIAELEKGHQEAAKQINSWRRLAKQNIAERGKDISELEAARQRIAELENSETQLINERDAAESALADMYKAATGERPEWSNMFGFADAVDVVEERLATLEANQSQTTPTGIQLITEAIGAHGYIVGCLLQGRPDLALEESRKWVSAFGQAAEIVSAQDAAGIKVKGE
ncbi:ead/Ea22-like family protein [Salmonella enterica subsp. houtenae]|nr:ead/Ea22-like family protein [Salmonella enterica subsp. houtenae]EEJ0790888.1 ead/Ea22-like family protein [Salmonella enterica]